MKVANVNDLFDSKIFNDEEIHKRILHVTTVSLNTKNIEIGNSSVAKLISGIKKDGWTLETRRQFRYFIETLDQRFSDIGEYIESTFLDLLFDKERVAKCISELQKKVVSCEEVIKKKDERMAKLESNIEKKDQTIANLTNTLLNFESSKIIEKLEVVFEELYKKKSSKKGTKAEFSK